MLISVSRIVLYACPAAGARNLHPELSTLEFPGTGLGPGVKVCDHLLHPLRRD